MHNNITKQKISFSHTEQGYIITYKYKKTPNCILIIQKQHYNIKKQHTNTQNNIIRLQSNIIIHNTIFYSTNVVSLQNNITRHNTISYLTKQ